MKTFDFGIGWSMPDEESNLFINTLKSECSLRNLSFILADEKNLDELIKKITLGRLKIKFYLDMASEIHDAKDKFTRFTYCLKDAGSRIVDDPDDVKAASDKSVTHFDLIKSQVAVPFSVVIRNWEPTRSLTDEERKGLGVPFIIKPALGYGQQGVKIIDGNQKLEEIAKARKFSKGDNFLLQEIIEPKDLNGFPAWFRVYHLFGEIIPCWWNPQTHAYRQVTLKDMAEYKLFSLVRIASEIARISRIDWFSCEIAVDKKTQEFIVIDYVNDQCAVAPQSLVKDGVCDEVITLIAERIVEKAWRHIMGKFTLTYRAVWFPQIRVKDADA